MIPSTTNLTFVRSVEARFVLTFDADALTYFETSLSSSVELCLVESFCSLFLFFLDTPKLSTMEFSLLPIKWSCSTISSFNSDLKIFQNLYDLNSLL